MEHLSRKLGPLSSWCLVVGTVIGTGIFSKTTPMAQYLPHAHQVLLVWIFAGILSFAGALTYGELCARLPRAGGEYAILKEAFGPTTAFTYGWMRFCIGGPGSIAAYAIFANYFFNIVTLEKIPMHPSIFIMLFSLFHCCKITVGATIQNILTIVKALFLIVMIGGILLFGNVLPPPLASSLASSPLSPLPQHSFFSAFGLAMISALWAYDGWNNLPMVGEEVKNPQRTLPMALGLGIAFVILVYVLVNLSYFKVLSIDEIQHFSGISMAPRALSSFIPEQWARHCLPVLVLFGLGAMNGSIMTSARVPFAMARDGLFFKAMAKTTSSTHVPAISILIQGLIASLFTFISTFDNITDYVVVASWLFYILCCASLFVLRKKHFHEPTTFLVPGYPLVPLLFILTSLLMIMNYLYVKPWDALIGAGIIAFGFILHLFFNKFHHRHSI